MDQKPSDGRIQRQTVGALRKNDMGDSAFPGSINSASSGSSAGELGWLWTLLGVGLVLFLVNDNNSGSGSE